VKIKDVDFTYVDSHYSKQIASFEVEVESVHNFKELYKRVSDWLVFEDFKSAITGDPEFYETLYWERQFATHKEHQIWWRAWKRPLDKSGDPDTNDYFTYFFKINFQTIRLRPAEVMHKGKKWSTNESDTIVKIKAYLLINSKTWESGKGLFGSFIAAMNPRFQSWFYKDKIWFHREFLYRKAFELQNVVKEYMGERLSQEVPPSIYKEKGLG
jgi:hypothetical protein